MTIDLPEKPIIKSQSNTAQRYQRMLDHLAESASAGDWDAVTDAQIKAFRLLANRSASWAEWDTELLRLELGDLNLW
jgi:hypothetical protein